MPQVRRQLTRGLIATFIVLLAGLATFALIRRDLWLGGTSDRTISLSLDLTDQLRIDPQLIDYQEIELIDLVMEKIRAIASGPQDKIYVAGDRAIHVFGHGGEPQDVVELESEPQCLFVGGPDQAGSGRLYVGSSDGITILSTDHQVLSTWPLPSEDMLPTLIAVAAGEIFIADAGNRIVWRFNESGEVIGEIGKADTGRQIPGFVVPNVYFDIVAGAEGLLYCVNPGKLQVSTFTFEGDLGGSWGQAGSSVANFFGCCNPSHIARFADGRFVTSERGIPRIKVYTPTGELESVVASPQQLGISEHSVGDPRHGLNEAVFDIAVDSQDRVLVLDPRTRTVRIFGLKID